MICIAYIRKCLFLLFVFSPQFKLLGAQLGLSTILSLRHVLDPSTFHKGGEMGMTTSANVTESNEKGNPNLQHENLKIDF